MQHNYSNTPMDEADKLGGPPGKPTAIEAEIDPQSKSDRKLQVLEEQPLAATSLSSQKEGNAGFGESGSV